MRLDFLCVAHCTLVGGDKNEPYSRLSFATESGALNIEKNIESVLDSIFTNLNSEFRAEYIGTRRGKRINITVSGIVAQKEANDDATKLYLHQYDAWIGSQPPITGCFLNQSWDVGSDQENGGVPFNSIIDLLDKSVLPFALGKMDERINLNGGKVCDVVRWAYLPNSPEER